MADSLKKTTSVALIMAAGSGERLGGEIPKQYQNLGRISVLRRTVLAFFNHPAIDAVAVVIHPSHAAFCEQAVKGLNLHPAIPGGADRQESVRLGLEGIKALNPTHVLIHDAARPLVSSELISKTLLALEKHDAVLPARALADTIKRIEAARVVGTVDRINLYAAQTPHGFAYEEILAAHQKFQHTKVTDDAGIAELAGLSVHTIPGERKNFKITTREDMQQAEYIIGGQQETRTGQGYDVHRLLPHASGSGNIMLCGVPIEHTHYLEGHSDADAGLHALVDALLATIAEGDIGQHFPPSDVRWKGADSGVFVRHACQLIKARGGAITSADITLICEAPKIAPHRETMRNKVAELLGVNLSRVSIKATTTEGLGFAGRKEGIAAMSIVTITLPVQQDD